VTVNLGTATITDVAAASTGWAHSVCEVWVSTTDQLRPCHLPLLDDHERARADRFLRPDDRARSLLAAALFRLVSARLLDRRDHPDGAAARKLHVSRVCRVCGGPHGKPSVDPELHVSVSHAGGAVIVAATRLAPVGVDVEPVAQAGRTERVARSAFSPAELARVTNMRDALRYWTRKESIVKATGDGMAVRLADVQVSGPWERPRLRRWVGRPTPDCTLVDLDQPAGYLGALAVLSNRPFQIVVNQADHLLAVE
jgi:4'-phosphopantetheinyl transferase